MASAMPDLKDPSHALGFGGLQPGQGQAVKDSVGGAGKGVKDAARGIKAQTAQGAHGIGSVGSDVLKSGAKVAADGAVSVVSGVAKATGTVAEKVLDKAPDKLEEPSKKIEELKEVKKGEPPAGAHGAEGDTKEVPSETVTEEQVETVNDKLNKVRDVVMGNIYMLKAMVFERQGNRVDMLRTLRLASEAGVVGCQVKLGDKLLYGQGVGVEYVSPGEGAKWHLRAAEQGVMRSQLIAGDCFLQGVGFDHNPDECDRLLRMIKWEEVPESIYRRQLSNMCYQLGQIYLHGKILYANHKTKSWPVNFDRAFEWTKQAALLDHLDAIIQVADLYDRGIGCERDAKLAFENWRTAAERGDGHSAFNTGLCYFEGEGVIRNSMKAVEWVKLAAKRGDPKAYFTLGDWHYEMEMYEKSVEEFQKAADAGLARAQYAVGWHYYYGAGVLRNFAEAVKWFYKAADHDCAEAFFYLGMCTLDGRGLAADREEAERLLKYSSTLNPKLETIVEKLLTDSRFNEQNRIDEETSASIKKKRFGFN